MAKYLEVTIRVPVREQYEGDVLSELEKHVSIRHTDYVNSAAIHIADAAAEEFSDVPGETPSILVESLAHVIHARIVEE